MEKEVKIAIIGGIFAVLVTAIEVGPGIFPGLFGPTENDPPKLNADDLTPDKASPMVAGKAIMWTADASDPNNDPLEYRFMLSGPSTDNKFVKVREWGSDNTWTWDTNDENIGTSQVQVQVRDGKHAVETGSDAYTTMDYEIVPKDETPVLGDLTPDKASPMVAGKAIMWTADASDPNNDPLEYRFMLSGPSTDNKFVKVREWGSDNTWTWDTNDENIGTSQVQVQVRDGKHAAETGSDDSKTMDYEIVAKVEPEKTSPFAGITHTITMKQYDDLILGAKFFLYWEEHDASNNPIKKHWSSKNFKNKAEEKVSIPGDAKNITVAAQYRTLTSHKKIVKKYPSLDRDRTVMFKRTISGMSVSDY